MSNKTKIFHNAFKKSTLQCTKTYSEILPSQSPNASSAYIDVESDPTNLWQGLWAQGEMACLFGEQGVGKSILSMQIAKQLTDRGLTVEYFDLKDCAYTNEPLLQPSIPPGLQELSHDELIDFLSKEITIKKTQAVIIDDISALADSKNTTELRLMLKKLRIVCSHTGTAMLLIAGSRHCRKKDLTTADMLPGCHEIMHACDSVFSLSTASRHNAVTCQKTHYVKQHKNRMAPVIYSDDAVISAMLTTNDDGNLVFTNLQLNENERQLVRDNGFNTIDQRDSVIMHYHSLAYSTREIAAIVGISQAQVSRIIKARQEPVFISNYDRDLEMRQLEQQYLMKMGLIDTPQSPSDAPDASDSSNSSDASDSRDSSNASPTALNASDASDACDSSDSFDSFNSFNSFNSFTSPKKNTNSSLKKLMKKSHR